MVVVAGDIRMCLGCLLDSAERCGLVCGFGGSGTMFGLVMSLSHGSGTDLLSCVLLICPGEL